MEKGITPWALPPLQALVRGQLNLLRGHFEKDMK